MNANTDVQYGLAVKCDETIKTFSVSYFLFEPTCSKQDSLTLYAASEKSALRRALLSNTLYACHILYFVYLIFKALGKAMNNI